MLTQTAIQFAHAWISAWNQHDLDQIMTHYAETIEFSSPLLLKLLGKDTPIQGKQALADYFAKGLAAYPDLQFELVQTLAGVNSLVLYYRSVQDQMAAEFMVLNAAGLVERAVAHYSELG